VLDHGWFFVEEIDVGGATTLPQHHDPFGRWQMVGQSGQGRLAISDDRSRASRVQRVFVEKTCQRCGPETCGAFSEKLSACDEGLMILKILSLPSLHGELADGQGG
jgi:hypothetical protein